MIPGPEAVRRFLERASARRILVVGDVMLDAYVSGAVLRISPEAPVPVVAVKSRRYTPGGAAHVAANIRSLGAAVTLGGVTGVDEAAGRLREELGRCGIGLAALVEDVSRPTTVKTRVTAGGQQIVRFDDEDRAPLPDPVARRLEEACLKALSAADACVLSDYAKGVVGERFCRVLIDEANRLGKALVVDPKSPDFARYRGATVIAPNTKETAKAAALPIADSADLDRAAGALLARIAPSALLVTRSEEGMSLFEPEEHYRGTKVTHLPALVSEVADVTGAGDTVVAVLALALATGFSLEESAQIANLAASVAVAHHGTWAVQPDELELAAARHTQMISETRNA